MIRQIIQIDEAKCNGCGLCAKACREAAIAVVDGKARLLRDDYCDGLGNCLPVCPTGAITFIEREAAAFDEEAVKAHTQQPQESAAGGCPGSRIRAFNQREQAPDLPDSGHPMPSQLRQWPVQLKLAPVAAPYFSGADVLVAADCTAYAYGDFHRDFIRGRVALVGCPKLDDVDYADKLCAIFAANDIASVTVVRMEVPCCGGIESAARRAIERSGRQIPCRGVTLSIDGRPL